MMTKVIKTTNGVSKVVDMQTSIWNTIVKGEVQLPEGTTYTLAPKFNAKENVVELINLPPKDGTEHNISGVDAIEPIQEFKAADFEELETVKRGRKPFKK
jgi:hypothetical protein